MPDYFFLVLVAVGLLPVPFMILAGRRSGASSEQRDSHGGDPGGVSMPYVLGAGGHHGVGDACAGGDGGGDGGCD